ncbi:tetratricopeptide repeat protein [Desulfoplanes sp.]
MSRHRISIYSPMTLLLCVMLCGPTWAAGKNSSDRTFTDWLEHYQAWDVYEKELSIQPNSPDNILARGETLLRLDKPKKVVSLLATPLSDPVLENRRLLLLARANRLVGDYQACIFNWLAFAQSSDPGSMRGTMGAEQGLGLLFEDVWKQWFWESFFTQDPVLFETRQSTMAQMLELGGSVWPDNPFWPRVGPIFSDIRGLFPPAPSRSLSIEPDRELIGRTLAAWSLGFWEQGDGFLDQVSDPHVSTFWDRFAALVGRPSNSAGQDALEQSGRDDFFTLFSPDIRMITKWVLIPPETPSWPSFAQKIQSLDTAQALRMVTTEQESLFLPASIRKALDVCAFALKLEQGAVQPLEHHWDKLTGREQPPPLLLQLAYMILGGHPSMPEKISEAILARYLLSAAKVAPDGGVVAEFWHQPEPTEEYPLDYLMGYGKLAGSMAAQPDHAAATHLAFLYPQAPAAQKGLLFLARKANRAGHQNLAWSYLQKIQTKDLDASDRIEFLLARAGMEMELGYEDAALKDYAILMEERPGRIPPEKQLKLALLGQQKRQWGWAQQILESLWQRRATLKEPIRAEILFWLGEGAQSRGRMQEALAYYLRLAWSYPEQNIWAVTAMYRAGLIYEKRRDFETAKRLYTTVLKQSDRKSQKEAARTRIASVSADMKKNKQTLPMPLF